MKSLKVGFDLDGTILYNPARITRPISVLVKKQLFHNNKVSFYHPKTQFQIAMWRIVHLSSLFIEKGFDNLLKLSKEKKIEAYIISSRFNCLKDGYNWWMKKLKVNGHFQGLYHNDKDEQPHLYKERMMKKLKLDYYVEDNYNIATHLSKTTNTNVIWIYNIFDRHLPHPLKFPHLNQVAQFLHTLSAS
jgi:uncharacterized HAD superfamily protein